jgi:hypothetical protein
MHDAAHEASSSVALTLYANVEWQLKLGIFIFSHLAWHRAWSLPVMHG